GEAGNPAQPNAAPRSARENPPATATPASPPTTAASVVCVAPLLTSYSSSSIRKVAGRESYLGVGFHSLGGAEARARARARARAKEGQLIELIGSSELTECSAERRRQ